MSVPDAGIGVFAGTPPYATGNGGSGHHNAGKACFSCHGGNAPAFTVAGTVYTSGTTPAVGVEVRLVDASGAAFSVYTGANGNFYRSGGTFSSPGHAGARDATATDDMVQAVTSGDCNSCHCAGASCATTPIHVP